MKKHLLLALFFTLFLPGMISAQEAGRKISGIVCDSQGNPIAGATIKVNESTTATISDGSGQFSIALPAGEASLTASFLG